MASGDLAPALNASNESPSLFRFSGDPGLNIFSFVEGNDFEFAAGSRAFSGSGTWTLPPESYDAMLPNLGSGLIFAPADSQQDLPNATLIGRWVVKGAGSIFADGFESGNTSAWQ